MKLRVIVIAAFCAAFTTAYADTTTTTSTSATTDSSAATTDSNTRALTVAAANGSVMLGNKNNAATTTTSTATTQTPASQTSSNTIDLSKETDRISYALGIQLGNYFKSQNLPLNSAAVAQGVSDSYSGNKTLLSPKDIQNTFNNFEKTLLLKRQAQLAQQSMANKQAGDAYQAANKVKPGVITLPDGLQYKVTKPGAGNSPTDQDLVTVNFVGYLTNGQKFTSSYDSDMGKPVTFTVSNVIPGWAEALKMMKPGAVWEIVVPPNLAYGAQGTGPIGPNQTLIFKIELIAVTPPNVAAANTNSSAATATANQTSS